MTKFQRAAYALLAAMIIAGCGLVMNNEERLDRAEEKMAEGDYRAAIIDLKDVLRRDPDIVRGRLLLGQASLRTGDGASAEKEYRRAMELGTEPEAVARQFAESLLLQAKFNEILDEISLEGIEDGEDIGVLHRIYGDAYMALEDPQEAREFYTKALQVLPDDVNSRLGIVSSYAAEKNFIQARAALEHILTEYDQNSSVWLFAGNFSTKLGNLDIAEVNFRRALELASGDADRLQAIVGISNTLLEKNQVDEARAYVEQLLIERPDAIPTMLLAARLAYLDGVWEVAQQYLQDVLRQAPNHRIAQMLLGAVHLQSGSLAQAEMYLSAAVAAEPDNIMARRLLAETQIQMGKGGAASQLLAPVLAGDTADRVSLQIAARASLAMQNFDDALEYLQRSVDEEPTNVENKLQLAAALIQTGRIAESEEVLDSIETSGSEQNTYRKDVLIVLAAMREQGALVTLEAAKRLVAKYSDQAYVHNLLGSIQLAVGDQATAASSFEKAVDLDGNNVIARRYLAGIDLLKGDYASAKTRFEEILGLEPDSAWAWTNLARVEFRDKENRRAIEYLRRALDLEPDNPDYRLTIAQIEKHMGNSEAAIQVLAEGVAAGQTNVASMAELGLLRAKAGEISEALEIASTLQRQDPENPVAHALEGEIHLVAGDLAKAQDGYEKAASLGQRKTHVLRLHSIRQNLARTDAADPLRAYLASRPLDSEIRIALAQYLDGVGDRRLAITEYETVLRNDAENAIALNNLAWNYYLAGDSRAVATAEKAHAVLPDNAAVLDTAGWIHVEMGSAERGESLLRLASEKSGGRAEIRFHHSAALTKLGKFGEARKILEELLEREGDFPSREDAEKLLAELQT